MDLKIISYSVVEATKFFLNEGVECVVTGRFCQNSVEEYFGSQRKIGRRNLGTTATQLEYSSLYHVSLAILE